MWAASSTSAELFFFYKRNDPFITRRQKLALDNFLETSFVIEPSLEGIGKMLLPSNIKKRWCLITISCLRKQHYFQYFLYFDFCFLNIFFQSNDFKLRKSHKSNLIFAHKQCNSSQIQHRKHHGEIAVTAINQYTSSAGKKVITCNDWK